MNTNHPAEVDEVRRAFAAYEKALLANDIPKLEAFFWNSPSSVRFGPGEQLYGYDAIVDYRRKRKLNFSYRTPVNVEISVFDSKFASVMYEYDCDIDGVERRGRQSQTWIRVDDAWKILSAHISYLPVDRWMDAMLEGLDLAIRPEWRSRIEQNVATTSRLADPLMRFPLPEEVEPESIFEP